MTTKFDKSAYDQEYAKAHIIRVALNLNTESDADIIEWLNNQPNKQGYIKQLIREKMK